MSPGDIRPEPNVARFGLETFRRMSPGDIRAVARHSEKLVRALTFLHWFPLGNGLETFVAECRQRMSPMSPANECRKRMSPNVANVAKGRECRQCRQETFRMSPGDFQPWRKVSESHYLIQCARARMFTLQNSLVRSCQVLHCPPPTKVAHIAKA